MSAKLYKIEANPTAKRIMHFKSGILTGKSFNSWKINKYIKISYIAPIHIKVYLHTLIGIITILDKELPADKNHIDLRSKGDVSGYGLSYEITGKGKVLEIGFTNE